MRRQPILFSMMLPRWGLPLRIPSRMGPSPSSRDSGSSLEQLRNMQAAIRKRRSVLTKSDPQPVEANANDLVKALFPDLRPPGIAAETGMDSDKVSKGDTGDTSVEGGCQDLPGPESGPGLHDSVVHTSYEGRGNSQSFVSEHRMEPRREKVTENIQTKAGHPHHSTSMPKSESISQNIKSNRYMSTEAAQAEPSATFTDSRTFTSGIGAETKDSASFGATHANKGVRKDNQYRFVRSSGSLPWLSEEKVLMSEKASVAGKVFEMRRLSLYINDPSLAHAEGNLPHGISSCTDDSIIDNNKFTQPDEQEIIGGLNELQTSAVLANCDKACLVLAGPGSGKTRVLTHRIAYLVKKHKVSPYCIMAVTFTNKAAEEMRERVAELLKIRNAPDWATESQFRLAVGTFHSICVRILRKYGSENGISPDFIICDSTDTKQIVSRLIKENDRGEVESGRVWEIIGQISKIKNDRNMELKERWPEHVYRRASQYRELYDRELRSLNQLDFDDLLLETRTLLRKSEKVLAELTNRYKHVLVDEWQDTNHVQFDIVALLASKRRNLFVVGDADQSIYKFRGADSGNLSRFSEAFPESSRVVLEQNYRSSACIVAAAQAIIERDESRPTKKMTTSNEFGNKVILREAEDDREEARFVVSTLRSMVSSRKLSSYSDVAILYRTNAQSRLLEESCIQTGTPYRLLSGTKFYDRQEIRDLVSYLRLISNPADDNAFRRIVNTPPRGIGKKTTDVLDDFSSSKSLSLMDGLKDLLSANVTDEGITSDVDMRRGALIKLAEFQDLILDLRKMSLPFLSENSESSGGGIKKDSVELVLSSVIKNTGYQEYLQRRENADGKNPEKVIERLANVDELVRAASQYSNLHQYLDSVALMTESKKEIFSEGDSGQVSKDAVSLMTLHGGKGLEFGAAFITGAENGLIPMTRFGNTDIEEERRLLYVGMTRAKLFLYITWRAKTMSIHGGRAFKRDSSGPSQFLKDIPKRLVQWKKAAVSKTETQQKRGSGQMQDWSTSGRNRQGGGSTKTRARRMYRVGDSIRCAVRGRGTVMGNSHSNSVIEVMFLDGSQHFVNTATENVQLLHSPHTKCFCPVVLTKPWVFERTSTTWKH